MIELASTQAVRIRGGCTATLSAFGTELGRACGDFPEDTPDGVLLNGSIGASFERSNTDGPV